MRWPVDAAKLSRRPRPGCSPAADHFFADHADTLVGHVDAYIAAHDRFAPAAEPATGTGGRGR